MILALVVQVENINNVMDKLINHSEPKTVIQVSVGIVANAAGELLIAKRPAHWLGGGFWEFPGGKIEPNEDSVTALKRELQEEVGIAVAECSPLISLTHEYPERIVVLHAWQVKSFSGQATGLEGQEICWRYPDALNQINMLPANRAIVVATQIPDTYLITPDCQDKTLFLKHLATILASNAIKLVQLRSKNLNGEQYISLARESLAICREYQVALLLNHADVDILNIVDADGIQLTSSQLYQYEQRPVPAEKWLAASCHDLAQIAQAEKIGADFLTISPVKDSSHKEGIGWQAFADLIAAANLPVYGLGGLSSNDIAVAKRYGAQGIAAIRSLWW